jgi:AcrR family transcriptional regulator
VGLRETKKRQTRAAIADAALALFLDRGFEQVTVAEVAVAAGVSTNTVFNYFAAKEDLFFDRQAAVEGHLSAVVRDRPAGTCAIDAVRADLLAALDRGEPTLGLDPAAADFWRVVGASPALRAREREIGERAEERLAAVLAEQAAAEPGDPLPAILAAAICGAYRAVLREIRRRVTANEPPAEIRRVVRKAAQQAFDLLHAGLEGYPHSAFHGVHETKGPMVQPGG